MTARTWHKGPPPHVGWWNASWSYCEDAWRWWGGKRWSNWCASDFDLDFVAIRASSPEPAPFEILWTDYWPENARVPRVDPRQPVATRIVHAQARMLLALADQYGMNVTIERVPLEPLAMGNTAPAIHVWPKRGAA